MSRLMIYAGLALAAAGILGMISQTLGTPPVDVASSIDLIVGGLVIAGVARAGSILLSVRSDVRRMEKQTTALDRNMSKQLKELAKKKAEAPRPAKLPKAPKPPKPEKPKPEWMVTGIAEISLGDDMTCRMYCPNKKAYLRSTDMLTKEPGTIAWLDTMTPEDVLWDVGANIGLFTLYAAMKRGVSVVAFEPGSANYMVLNRNLELNELHEKVTAFCVAIAESSAMDYLYMPATDFGSAQANFGAAVDYQGAPFEPKFKQGSVAYSLDTLMNSMPLPTHVKIDVDGLERSIVLGGSSFFDEPRIRSVLIELDVSSEASIQAMADLMRSHGFVHTNEGAYVEGRKVFNAVFSRPEQSQAES